MGNGVLRQVLKQCFWDCYDHLGRLFIANVLLFFLLIAVGFAAMYLTSPLTAVLPPAQGILILFVAFAVVTPLTLTLWLAPLIHFGALVSAEKNPAFGEFARGLRLHGFRLWKYTTLLALIIGVLLVNIWFYTYGGLFPERMRFIGFILAGLCFWMLLFASASALAALPMLVREQLTAVQALKRGFACLLRQPLPVLSLAIFIASLWIISLWLRGAPVFLFGFSGTAMLMNSLHDVMKARELESSGAVGESPEKGSSWRDIRQREAAEEKQRMDRVRYERTLRDLLRPWEG